MINYPGQIRIFVLINFLCFLLYYSGNAQINTEKYRKYYNEEHGYLFNAITTFSVKAGNTEYTALKGTGRIDHNGKKIDSFLIGNFEYKKSSGHKIENQGFLHLRGILDIEKHTTWEFFVQRQYDEFIDLNSRNLAGTAIKHRLVGYKSLNDSTISLDINISTGLMYETEEYQPDNTKIENFLWRSTNFVSVDWLIRQKLNLTGVVYYQPSFNNFSNYRIAAEAGFEFAVAKSLFFIFNLTYRYNNIPVTDVKPFDISIDNGIRVEIK